MMTPRALLSRDDASRQGYLPHDPSRGTLWNFIAASVTLPLPARPPPLSDRSSGSSLASSWVTSQA
jgi:hypothetical protein